MRCFYCNSESVKRNGFLKTKRGKSIRYKCKACYKTFTNKIGTMNHRKRKQHLREKIEKMYCERMSLKGIARVLNINYKTVVRYFKENAENAKTINRKRLHNKGLVTRFIQFDQMETYEHTKKKPVGIQISIRWKTGEIISAKVGYIPVRALTVSKAYSEQWNSQVNESHTFNMLWESKQALDRSGALVSCDQAKGQVNILKEVYTEPFITLSPSSSENKKIDRVFRKMRQDISRLGRKTLSTTKKIANLQRHLDLYINYNNQNRV